MDVAGDVHRFRIVTSGVPVKLCSMLHLLAVETSLPPESWGDQLHRAYRLARHREGSGFTYREVARRISRKLPTSDVAIIRLESLATRPTRERQRQLAVLCVAVYGFDPAAFGLDLTNTDPMVFDWIEAVAEP